MNIELQTASFPCASVGRGVVFPHRNGASARGRISNLGDLIEYGGRFRMVAQESIKCRSYHSDVMINVYIFSSLLPFQAEAGYFLRLS